MFTLFAILIAVAALIVIGLVLVQESKGGGLISRFGDIGHHIGVQKTKSILEKGTWVLAGDVILLCINFWWHVVIDY